MVGNRIDYEEIILLRIMELNQLMPHYWSELFVLTGQLLNENERIKLNKMIRQVERLVLDEDHWYNYFGCEDCNHKWKREDDWYEIERCPKCRSSMIKILKERQSLYDIEMVLESNIDLNSYFLKGDSKIYKFDVERRLNKIKEWIYSLVRQRAEHKRFKRVR